MPYFDQHWQLRWLGVGVVAVAAVLFPLWYLHVAAVWDHLRGWDMLPDDLFAVGTTIVLVGVAFLFRRSARRAQARLQWRMERLAASVHRRRASRGTSSDPPAPEESVSIVLRIGIGSRAFAWLIGVPFFIAFALGDLLVLGLVVGVLINPGAFQGETVRVFLFLILVPPIVLSLWVSESFASDAWTRSPRFELDQYGITWKRVRGRSVTIRWQEARLLEEAARYRPEGRQIQRRVYYLLYGTDDTVIRIDTTRWYSREARQLLALISKHTGLVPRSLDQPSLHEDIMQLVRLPHIER
jgi:hypothetical protein